MNPLAATSVTCMLPVKDLARAHDFYERQLGLEPLGAKPDGKFVYRSAGTELALFPKPERHQGRAHGRELPGGGHRPGGGGPEGAGRALADYDLPGLRRSTTSAFSARRRRPWFEDPEGNILCLLKTWADAALRSGRPAIC